ncbi:hypothetical protein CN122_23425 [Sinorhizobium meliloti]|nr:hypothetical protein CN122_23425 [Sinorhizobium meliloti]
MVWLGDDGQPGERLAARRDSLATATKGIRRRGFREYLLCRRRSCWRADPGGGAEKMTPEEIMKAVLFFLTVAGAGWGIWWKIDSRVKEGEKSTEGRIRVAEERASKVAEDLAGFKLRAAETYATKAGMEAQTAQIMRAIEGVGSRIDAISERLDRVFESRTSGRRTST